MHITAVKLNYSFKFRSGFSSIVRLTGHRGKQILPQTLIQRFRPHGISEVFRPQTDLEMALKGILAVIARFSCQARHVIRVHLYQRCQSVKRIERHVGIDLQQLSQEPLQSG